MFLRVEVIADEIINNIINDNGLFQQMHRYVINNRVKVIRATLAPTGRVVYFASWHGPHNHITDVGKEETASDLIRLMRIISGRQPFIIGGDFNLLADNEFPEIDRVRHQTPNGIIPHDIDYFVLGNRGEFNVQNVTRPLPLENRDTLDHEPVQATFSNV